jgi:hypothetical protein
MRMLWRSVAGFIGMSMFLGLLGAPAAAENKSVNLDGFAEVPSVITDGTGRLRIRIDGKGTEIQIQYTLSYEDIDPAIHGTIRFAHIHIGATHTNGGVVVFLCTNEAPPPNVPVPPLCPPSPGTVSGTLTAADVIAVPAQGIGPGDLEGVIEGIRKGVAYGNVHTIVSPGGVIRGQFHGRH